MDRISSLSIVRQVIGAGGLQALGQLVSFLGIIAYTNLAPISVVGSYFLFFGLVRVLTFLGSAGTVVDLVRKINQASSPSKSFSTALFFLSGISVILMAGVMLLAPMANSYIGAQVAWALALFIPVEMVSNVYMSALKGEQKNISADFSVTGRKIVMYVSGTLGLVIGVVPIVTLIGGAVGSRLLQLVFMIFATEVRVVSTISLKDFRSLVYDIRHTSVVSVSNLGQEWIDTLLIGVFLTQGAVAVYEIAWRFSAVALILTNAITSVLYPRLSALIDDGEYELVKDFSVKGYLYSITPVIALLTGGIVVGERLIAILYGIDYIGGFLPFVVLLTARIFYTIRRVAVVILYALGDDALVSRVSIIAVLMNAILNGMLIPLYGLLGAAVGTLSSFVLLGVVTAYYVKNELGFGLPLVELGRVSVAAVIMTLVILLLEPMIPSVLVPTLTLVGTGAAIFLLTLVIISPAMRSDAIWLAQALIEADSGKFP